MQKFALLLLVAISALAAEDPIANTATKELPAKGIPGAVVVIVRDGQIAYGQGFGRLSAERDTPMTADALFRVGSCTKMITALTAVSLANEHGIPLDAAVGRYVSGLSPRLSQATLQQLLTHTAGIHDEIVATPLEQHADESELLREVRSWTDATFFTDPGDIFSYSNLGFVLIGAFIEQVSGHRYADEVTARVLRPLGITDATFRPETAVTYPFAQGHIGLRSEAPKVVRPIRRLPAPRAKKVSVVAGLSETMRDGAVAGTRIGLPKSSRSAGVACSLRLHPASVAATMTSQIERAGKNKTDTPPRGMPATSTRQ